MKFKNSQTIDKTRSIHSSVAITEKGERSQLVWRCVFCNIRCKGRHRETVINTDTVFVRLIFVLTLP